MHILFLVVCRETVKKDMQEWQHSGIWPFSCYGPVGGKPNVPGFEDISPEEHRYNFMLSGCTVPPAVTHQLQQLIQLRMNYQQPTQENRNIIERIATTSTPGATTNTTASIFGGGSTVGQQQGSSILTGSSLQQPVAATSVFGGGAGIQQPGQTTSLFGGGGGGLQQQATSSIFGGGASVGQQSAGSIFGAGASLAQQSTGGIFGGAAALPSATGASTGIFGGGGSSTQGLFGQSVAGPTATSGGGLFQNQQQQSIFGGAQSTPFGQSAFGQSAATQQPTTNLFQQQTLTPNQFQASSGNLFQQPQAQIGGFQQQQQGTAQSVNNQSIFGKPEAAVTPGTGQGQTPSLFGNTAASLNAPQPSIFGGGTGNSPLTMGGNQGTTGQQFGAAPTVLPGGIQKGVYTDESELTAEELEAFRSNEFTLESLPTRPPPQNLCV